MGPIFKDRVLARLYLLFYSLLKLFFFRILKTFDNIPNFLFIQRMLFAKRASSFGIADNESETKRYFTLNSLCFQVTCRCLKGMKNSSMNTFLYFCLLIRLLLLIYQSANLVIYSQWEKKVSYMFQKVHFNLWIHKLRIYKYGLEN